MYVEERCRSDQPSAFYGGNNELDSLNPRGVTTLLHPARATGPRGLANVEETTTVSRPRQGLETARINAINGTAGLGGSDMFRT